MTEEYIADRANKFGGIFERKHSFYTEESKDLTGTRNNIEIKQRRRDRKGDEE